MTSPIVISDLDPADPIDAANDLLLIRQGFNDRKATVDQVAGIRLTPLSMLPDRLNASDVLLIGRNVAGEYENYIMPPQYLGFLNGTNCWFYQATAPLGWTIIPETGNRLLAVSDLNGNLYNGQAAPGQTGTWQQGDVGGVPGQGLTIAQMPAHNHTLKSGHSSEDGIYVMRNKNSGGTFTTSASGSGAPHNHGNVWRPLANVGILCTKDKDVGA